MVGKIPQSRLRPVAVGTTATLMLSANPRRRGFTIFGSTTQAVFIGDRDTLTTSAISTPAGFPPVHYCAYLQGNWVQGEIYCLASVATGIGILEVLEP